MEEQKEEYLTVGELAGRIKFSRQSIYNLIFKGEFIFHQHYLKPRPKKILFIWAEIKAWMENPSGDHQEVPEVPLTGSDSGEEIPVKVVKVKLPESAIKI